MHELINVYHIYEHSMHEFLTNVDDLYFLHFCEQIERKLDILHLLCINSGLFVVATDHLVRQSLHESYQLCSVYEIDCQVIHWDFDDLQSLVAPSGEDVFLYLFPACIVSRINNLGSARTLWRSRTLTS